MMGSYGFYSSFHWAAGLVGFLVLAIPGAMILRKAGYSGWWVLIILVPILNLIMYWMFAFTRWPIEERNGGR
jgi:uncharacterized membrane protein YhaH (DUF805 family)